MWVFGLGLVCSFLVARYFRSAARGSRNGDGDNFFVRAWRGGGWFFYIK